MAINDLRELGISIDLFVYDTQRDSVTVDAIFRKHEMKKMDLIIGPVYSENFDIAANFANEHRINIVSPLSRKKELLTEIGRLKKRGILINDNVLYTSSVKLSQNT